MAAFPQTTQAFTPFTPGNSSFRPASSTFSPGFIALALAPGLSASTSAVSPITMLATGPLSGNMQAIPIGLSSLSALPAGSINLTQREVFGANGMVTGGAISGIQGERLRTGVSLMPPRVIPAFWRQFQSGAFNAITDVPGLKIGHVSVMRDLPSKVRTGVTAIVPDAAMLTRGQGNLATTGFRAAGATLNGNGELTGMGPLTTSGILNSPVVLTNTYSVGVAHQGVFDYFARRFPGQWSGQLPVVGECWDGFYSHIEDPVLTPQDTVAAIESARGGPVAQGRVGAGTGMRSFEMHAGIGSASRKIMLNGREYTIGVLVNANHSKLYNLNPMLRIALEQALGRPLEAIKTQDDADHATRPPQASPRQGSIMTVIATDLPLDSKALHQLAERAGLGIGNTGSVMATNSGDFAVAFSTANPVPLGNNAPDIVNTSSVHPDALTPILQATVEAVTEAQVNALVAAHSP